MARIRTIKPEFWADGKVSRVCLEARLLFLGLLNESDDEGRQIGSPKRIAGQVFPHDEAVTAKEIEGWLVELERESLVSFYEVDGVVYLLLPGFMTHQKVSHPSPSRFPPESSGTTYNLGGEPLQTSSGIAPEVLAPDLGIDLGSGSRNSAPAAQNGRAPDLIWEAMLAACGITGEISPSARGAYNKARSDLVACHATPETIRQRATVYRMRWPDVSLTPTALARRWSECEPNTDHLPAQKVSPVEAFLLRDALENS